MSTQNANTNLDQDLRESRESKYRKSQKEALQWILATLEIPESEKSLYESKGYDLAEALKDGYLLCSLGQRLSIANNPTSKYKSSRMPFIQMENILFFLQVCKMVGVEHDEIFQTIDLFENKDPYQVVVTLMAFSREANKLSPDKFPLLIGPKVTKTKPPVPRKPIGLRS